ncbi:MAG TPA: molybdopterin-dependent oxidoreductase [Chloroflexota bacterium]|nr:molybdopterin-dependent oxidoreductase [Chloroflexota bacterium]
MNGTKSKADQRDDLLAWTQATLTSVYASGVALVLMFWARQALQIRTLPERLMETILRVLPPALFEATIDRFGPVGKDYALYGTTAAVFAGLVGIGVLALRFLRRPFALLALGLALYLVAMGVIAPLTGAGVFATNLFVNPVLSNAVSLGIGMAYASVLLASELISPAWLARRGPSVDSAENGVRRVLIASLAISAVSFVMTLVAGRSSGRIVSTLPVAAAPTASIPTPLPTVAAPPAPAITPAGVAAPTVTPAPTSAPTVAPTAKATPASGYAEAPPERPLPRDKDGTLLAVKRTKGEIQALTQLNSDFYVVTKNAAGDPVLNIDGWRLIIDGAVNRPVQVDYQTLRQLPAVHVAKTLECISNLTAKCDLTSFGCDLISTAQWTGARLTDVLALAHGLKPGVVTIAAISADEYSSAVPAAAATDPEVLLVYAMNGAVLPREHGFPVRLLVPGRYGLKNAKWLVNLRPMTQQYVDWWGQRNWSQTAIVKTMSRIDVPLAGARLQAGSQRIGGIAYAGTRGITKVEFSTNAGKTWQVAALKPGPGKDAFVQWEGSYSIAAGAMATLSARATDGQGNLQIEQFNLPQPDGGAGWDSIQVTAV